MTALTPRVYTSNQHPIQTAHIDADALEILNTLYKAGYKAHLVGGSIRDLLTGLTPKDFDISTSATPEQIKSLFKKRCLLIGRRFRLAHIRYGQKIIEVSTFRSGDTENNSLITHDNQWGTPEEDVLRRDFTINALFYDAHNQTIIDYFGGVQDIVQRQLKTVGIPTVRFQQDPVRMLRLIKFKARFGFEIDPLTYQALMDCKGEILKSSPARILEEICRMLESGFSASFYDLLLQTGLLKLLQPEINAFLKAEIGSVLFKYLRVIDHLIRYERVSLDRSLLISCFVFPMVDELIRRRYLSRDVVPQLSQIIELIEEVVRRVIGQTFITFPNRVRFLAAFILEAQYRFNPLSGSPSRYRRIVEHPDFPYALQFLGIRSLVDNSFRDSYQQWKTWRHQPIARMRKGKNKDSSS